MTVTASLSGSRVFDASAKCSAALDHFLELVS